MKTISQPHIECFALDSKRACLLRDGEVVKLRPKSFDLLLYLAHYRGRLVRKEELIQALWPDSFVTDDSLVKCVQEVRRALRDDSQILVKTLPRRGYMLEPGVFENDRRTTGHFEQGSRVVADTTRLTQLFRRPSHFVGRDLLLKQFMERWIRVREGRRQTVFIAGESGVGKTAVVNTFVAQLEAAEVVNLARGQCLDHFGVGEAYLPLLEALGRLGRGRDGEHLVATLRKHAPSWLCQMPSLSSDHASERQIDGAFAQPRMLRELAEALEVFAVSRPMILVLDRSSRQS